MYTAVDDMYFSVCDFDWYVFMYVQLMSNAPCQFANGVCIQLVGSTPCQLPKACAYSTFLFHLAGVFPRQQCCP